MKDFGHFPITYWFGIPDEYLKTENGKVDVSRIEEIKEAGMNLLSSQYSVQDNIEVLKIAEKLGLFVNISDARIRRAVWCAEERRELLAAAVEDYKDYPALHSYYITDEPNASDFEALASVKEILQELDPVHEAYINLFPNYASHKQLGNETYAEHIEEYLKKVKPEMLSYDHYHFMTSTPTEMTNIASGNERERLIREAAVNKVERAGFFDNFETVRELCLKYDTPYMIIVLLVAHGPYRYLGESEIRWEVFQSLAYGTSRMSYFTYWTPDSSHDPDDFWKWNNGMISQNGERTAHYDMVKEINRELAATGDALMGKKSIGVFHTVKAPETLTRRFEGFGKIISIEGDDMTVGFFEDDYVVIANKSYEAEGDCILYTDSAIEVFEPFEKEWLALENENGKFILSLDKGDGILFRLIEV